MIKRSGTTRFVAVEYDACRLRIADVDAAGRKPRVVRLGSFDLPPALSPTDAPALGRFVGEKLGEMRLSRRPIVMSVARSQAVLRPLSLPAGSAHDELAGMVRYQVQRDLPFSADDAVIDFTVDSHYHAESPDAAGLGSDVLAAAVRRHTVEHHQQLADAAGAKLLHLSLRPYANLATVRAAGLATPDQGVVLVTVTADETQVDVFFDESVGFSRAGSVRVPMGESVTDADRSTAVVGVAMEASRSLKSFQAVQRGQVIDRILVAGGTGVESAVAEVLEHELGVSAAVIDPGDAIRLPRRRDAFAGYVSVIGLALCAARPRQLAFDFLHPKQPARRADPRKRRFTRIAAAAVVVLLGVIGGAIAYRYGPASELLRLQQARTDLKGRLRTAQTDLKRALAVDAWVEDSRAWLDPLAHVSALAPPAEQAYIDTLRLSSDAGLVVDIRAREASVVTAFGRRLADAGYAFVSGAESIEDDPYGFVYRKSLRIAPPQKLDVDLAELPPVQRPADDASRQLIVDPPGHRRDGRGRGGKSG